MPTVIGEPPIAGVRVDCPHNDRQRPLDLDWAAGNSKDSEAFAGGDFFPKLSGLPSCSGFILPIATGILATPPALMDG